VIASKLKASQQDHSRQQLLAFINVNTRSDQQPLFGNNVVPFGFQTYTEGAALQILRVNWFYINAELTSVSGTNSEYFQEAFAKGVFGAVEVNL